MEGVEVINGLGCKMSCSSYKVNSESILKPNRYEVSCFDNLELEEPIYTHIYKGWLLHLALMYS